MEPDDAERQFKAYTQKQKRAATPSILPASGRSSTVSDAMEIDQGAAAASSPSVTAAAAAGPAEVEDARSLDEVAERTVTLSLPDDMCTVEAWSSTHSLSCSPLFLCGRYGVICLPVSV